MSTITVTTMMMKTPRTDSIPTKLLRIPTARDIEMPSAPIASPSTESTVQTSLSMSSDDGSTMTTTSTTTFTPREDFSRLDDLERKRQQLVHMRVSLECKLFDKNCRSPEFCSPRRTEGGSESHLPSASCFSPLLSSSSSCYSNISLSGRGKYIWKDGKSVTGQWAQGKLNGRCFFQWPSGETYDGDVKDGQKHGRGVHTWADGKIYKGQYENGFEHGFGSLTQPDGRRYRGEFQYGKRSGVGTQIWPDKTYEGQWNENALCGQGKLTWNDGKRYEGQFWDGKYQGHGAFVDNRTGRKYVGLWVNGRKEGWGRETWPFRNTKTDNNLGAAGHSSSYEGFYRNGFRHGFGRFFMADGSQYVGGWENGERSGYGITVSGHGDVVHCGLWNKDSPVLSSTKRDNVLLSFGESAVSWPQLLSNKLGCDDLDWMWKQRHPQRHHLLLH